MAPAKPKSSKPASGSASAVATPAVVVTATDAITSVKNGELAEMVQTADRLEARNLALIQTHLTNQSNRRSAAILKGMGQTGVQAVDVETIIQQIESNHAHQPALPASTS